MDDVEVLNPYPTYMTHLKPRGIIHVSFRRMAPVGEIDDGLDGLQRLDRVDYGPLDAPLSNVIQDRV